MASGTTVVVSGLTDYVNVRKDELIVKSATGAKTLDYIEIMPNVKYKDSLNYLDSTVVLADGSACSWDPDGSDVYSDRTIEVHPVKVNKEVCWKDFRKKWMNYQLLFAAGREKMPFEEKYVESNLNAIANALEDIIWQGNSGLTIEGFIPGISGETDATIVNVASGSTATAMIDAAVAALPATTIKKRVNLFVSYTDFKNYVQEQNASCCANRPVLDANSETLTYAGDSRVVIVPVMGLESQNVVVAATSDALVYGTDVEDSEAIYKIWLDDKTDMFNFKVLFNAGTAVKRPDEVVMVVKA